MAGRIKLLTGLLPLVGYDSDARRQYGNLEVSDERGPPSSGRYSAGGSFMARGMANNTVDNPGPAVWMLNDRRQMAAVPEVLETLPTLYDQAGVPITTSARWVRVNAKPPYTALYQVPGLAGSGVVDQIYYTQVFDSYIQDYRYAGQVQWAYSRNKGYFNITGRQLRSGVSYNLYLGYQDVIASNGVDIIVNDPGYDYTYIDYEWVGGDGYDFDATIEPDGYGGLSVTINNAGYLYTVLPTLNIIDTDGTDFNITIAFTDVDIDVMTAYTSTVMSTTAGTMSWKVDLGYHDDSVPPLTRPATYFWWDDMSTAVDESFTVEDLSPERTADGFAGQCIVPGTLPAGYLRRDETDTDRGGGHQTPAAYSPHWWQDRQWGDLPRTNSMIGTQGDLMRPPTARRWTYISSAFLEMPCRVGQAYLPQWGLYYAYPSRAWNNAYIRRQQYASNPERCPIRVWTDGALYDYDQYPPFCADAVDLAYYALTLSTSAYFSVEGINWRNMRVWYKTIDSSTTAGAFTLGLLSTAGFSSVGSSYSALTTTIATFSATPTTAWQYADVAVSTSATTWATYYHRLDLTPAAFYIYEVHVAMSPSYDVPLWFTACGLNNGVVAGGIMTSLVTAPTESAPLIALADGVLTYSTTENRPVGTVVRFKPARGRYTTTVYHVTECDLTGTYIDSLLPSAVTVDGDRYAYFVSDYLLSGPWSITLTAEAPSHTAISTSGTAFTGYGKITATATGSLLIACESTGGFRLWAKINGDGLVIADEADADVDAPNRGLSYTLQSAPPATPRDGDLYRVDAPGSGAWAGKNGLLAWYRTEADGTGAWHFDSVPPECEPKSVYQAQLRLPVTAGDIVYLRAQRHDTTYASGYGEVGTLAVTASWSIS